MAISQKEFEEKMNGLKRWILSSVPVFTDNSELAKEERRKRALEDKFYFAITYFPHYIEYNKDADIDALYKKYFLKGKKAEYAEALGFSSIHSELFDLADIHFTPVAIAGFRELAKSTIVSTIDELHKTVFKLNRFTMFLCDTQETAMSEFLLPLKAELEENPRLKNDFGNFKSKDWRNEDFTTSTGKRILGIGLKMGAKGKRNKGTRPDRIIIEDIENMNSSKKKTAITRKIKFILKDVGKSVNFKKWQLIFLGNYFSKKTVIHYLLTSDECKHWIRRVYSVFKEVKGKMKSVWEFRFPTKLLLDEKAKDPKTFRTEREQKPEDEEAMFSEEWIQYFDDKDVDMDKLTTLTYHDPSALKGEEHCYKAIIVLGVDVQKLIYYVLYAWVQKTSKWKSVDRHFQLSEKFRSSIDGIEANGYQSTLREDFEILEKKYGRRLNIKMITNRLPKETRISKLASPVERGFIKFRRNNGGDMTDLIDQLVDYPDGEYVDAPDALSGAVELADIHVTKKNRVRSSYIGD